MATIDKKAILKLVSDFGNEIGDGMKSAFRESVDNRSSGNSVGCNQFRELASNCLAADCYEEIVLLVEYSEAKSSAGRSWKSRCSNGKTFGKTLRDYMEKVKRQSGGDDWEKVREPMRLFFGYLYWQTRVWAAESESNNPRPVNGGDRNKYYSQGKPQQRR